MAKWLDIPPALPEDLSLPPSTRVRQVSKLWVGWQTFSLTWEPWQWPHTRKAQCVRCEAMCLHRGYNLLSRSTCGTAPAYQGVLEAGACPSLPLHSQMRSNPRSTGSSSSHQNTVPAWVEGARTPSAAPWVSDSYRAKFHRRMFNSHLGMLRESGVILSLMPKKNIRCQLRAFLASVVCEVRFNVPKTLATDSSLTSSLHLRWALPMGVGGCLFLKRKMALQFCFKILFS